MVTQAEDKFNTEIYAGSYGGDRSESENSNTPSDTKPFFLLSELETSSINSANVFNSHHKGGRLTFINPHLSVDSTKYPDSDWNKPTQWVSPFEVVDSKKVEIKFPYTITSKQGGDFIIPEKMSNLSFTLSFEPIEDEDSQVTSSIYQASYADITIGNLRTYSGDVHRAKIFSKRQGQTSNAFTKVADFLLQPDNALVNTESVSGRQPIGFFFTQSIVDKYWESSSADVSVTTRDTYLVGGISLSGSNENEGVSYTFKTKNNMVFEKREDYEVVFDLQYFKSDKSGSYGSSDDENPENISAAEPHAEIEVFLSGSIESENPDVEYSLGRLSSVPTDPDFTDLLSSESGSIRRVYNIFRTHGLENQISSGSLGFRISSGRFDISNISVSPFADQNFNPGFGKISVPMPLNDEAEVRYDFLAEFYDFNNNKSIQTAQTSASVLFEGPRKVLSITDDDIWDGTATIGRSMILHGSNPAFLASVGYKGFEKARAGAAGAADGGLLLFSGSIGSGADTNFLTASEEYDGVGIEIVDASAGSSNPGQHKFLRFRSNDPDNSGNASFRVQTDEFYFGQDRSVAGAQFVSGSEGRIEISSSNFHLDNDGSIIMQGSITATAGGQIGGFTITDKAISTTDFFLSGSTFSGTGFQNTNLVLSSSGFQINSAGSFKATTGEIGSFNIAETVEATPKGVLFSDSNELVITGSTGVISGSKVHFDGGKIGGWTIDTSTFTGGNITLNSAGTIKIKDVTGVTDTTSTREGVFIDNDGDILIKGVDGSSNKNYIQQYQGNLTIQTKAFNLDTDNLDINSTTKRISIFEDSDEGGQEIVRIGELTLTDTYGLTIFDGVGTDQDDNVIAKLGTNGNLIGGWEITNSQIRTKPAAGFGGAYAAGEEGLILQSDGRVETANFATNVSGWRIDEGGFAEFESARIRGTLKTTVFEKETVNAVGGQLMIANSTALEPLRDVTGSIVFGYDEMSSTFPTMSSLNVSGFSVGEILKAKKISDTGFSVEYLKISGIQRYSDDSTGSPTTASVFAAIDNISDIDPDGLSGELHFEVNGSGNRSISGFDPSSATDSSPSGSTHLTTLSTSTINTTVTSFDVADASDFSVQDIIKIGNAKTDERMKITAISSNTLTVVRDWGGTTAQSHASSDPVWLVDTDKEFKMDLVSTPVSYNVGQVFVSTGKYDAAEEVSTGYILLNANPNDAATPYMDIVERTGSGVYDLQLRSRIGDLSGLSSGFLYGDEEPGFGIFTENGFFRGSITAETGSITGRLFVDTSTTQKLVLGTDVPNGSSGNDGLYINANNYWYTTGDFKVGDTSNNFVKFETSPNSKVSINADEIVLDTTGNPSGLMKIDSPNEIIRLGDVTDFTNIGSGGTDKGILFGKESSGNYDFFVGDKAGNYLWYDDDGDGSGNGVLKVNGSITVTNTGDFAPTDAEANDPAQDNPSTYSFGPSADFTLTTFTPSTAGLYLGSSNMGYYNGGWKTYMDNSGQFFLSGTGGDSLSWDGSNLNVTGQITINNASAVKTQLDIDDLEAKVVIDGNSVKVQHNANNFAELSGSGMSIHENGDKIAQFSSTTRIGKSNDNRLEITDTTFKLFEGASNERIVIDGNGVQIKEDTNNFTEVSASGMSVFAGGDRVGQFAQDTIIGKTSAAHLDIKTSGGAGTNGITFTNSSGTDIVFMGNAAEVESFTQGGGACLLFGSQVSKSDGTIVNVEDLEVGDELLSVTLPNATDENVGDWKQDTFNVSSSFNQQTTTIENILHLTSDHYYNINDSSELITGTHYMLYRVSNSDEWVWEVAPNFEIGNFLMDKNGDEVEITSINRIEGDCNVVSIDTETDDFYVASTFMVHNKGILASGYSVDGTVTNNLVADKIHSTGSADITGSLYAGGLYVSSSTGLATTGSTAVMINVNDGTNEVFQVTKEGEVLARDNITAFTSITSLSDERLKEDIYTLSGSMNKILQLRPTEFTWKENKKQDIGFIAQEVEEIIPEVIHETKGFIDLNSKEQDDTTYKTISYEKLTVYLVDTIKELTKRIEELEKNK